MDVSSCRKEFILFNSIQIPKHENCSPSPRSPGLIWEWKIMHLNPIYIFEVALLMVLTKRSFIKLK
jgi:hypothetical protein